MKYVIDVVDADAASDYAARWRDEVRRLAVDGALRTAELFRVTEPIRDVTYALLSVHGFDSAATIEAVPGSASARIVAVGGVERTVCHLEVALSELTPTLPGHAWLINPFEISEQEIPGVLDMWGRARDHMAASDGFLNARLFRATSPSNKYNLFNVAQWRGAEDFKKSLGDKAYDRHRERSMNYRLHPSLCVQVHGLRFE
ncbi:hypothetical protein OV207_28250 [Corallococcus sp. BB11-1]|uniref:antibiotic biosynthesis monooxygenase family protein n=1 Tax=Corallococcus sp. BB11-1 TaxID=2996783 RepID=UPI002270CA76|nr:hypothetical protein [Corallococcus sp. BB11-1]MCY1035371.1 hypothetical protein [Corallococcus sp. BB11-1]